jgi:3-deoxy-D-manno-octulosonic acid kinase
MPAPAVAPPSTGEPAPADAALRRLRRGRCLVLTAPSLAAEAERLGLLEPHGLASLLVRADPGPLGRAPSACTTLADGRRLHLRPVRRGGLLAGLWRGRVLGLARPRSELRVTARLAAAGAPVARPAFVAGERGWILWRAAFATWWEPGARDARAFLAAGPAPARVARAAAAAGAALRRFHDAGGRHADLHAGNLLLREAASGCTALLVDLDRARCGRPPPASVRLAEMMRLHRSLVKLGLASRVGARGCAAFLRAYTGGDRRLRRALRRHLPRELRRLRLHRAGWRSVRYLSFAWTQSRTARSAATSSSIARTRTSTPAAQAGWIFGASFSVVTQRRAARERSARSPGR